MFRNYLQIALRTLQKQPGYAFINVFGLAVGMAAFFMIALLTVGYQTIKASLSSPVDALKYE